MGILINSILAAASTLPDYAIALIVVETIAVIGLGIFIVMDILGDRIKGFRKKEVLEISESVEVAQARQKAEFAERELAARLATLELEKRECAVFTKNQKQFEETVVSETPRVQEVEQITLPSADIDRHENCVDEDTEEVYSTEVDEQTATVKQIVLRRKYSFEAKLRLATDEVKSFYQEILSELLAYKKVKQRRSFSCESYRLGMPYLAKTTIRGKTLCLFLALDPQEFKDSKYRFVDMSDKKKYQDLPMLIKIKSGRGLKYAKELIALAANIMGAERKTEEIAQLQTANFEVMTLDSLIQEGLIKESFFENIYDMEGKLIRCNRIEKNL